MIPGDKRLPAKAKWDSSPSSSTLTCLRVAPTPLSSGPSVSNFWRFCPGKTASYRVIEWNRTKPVRLMHLTSSTKVAGLQPDRLQLPATPGKGWITAGWTELNGMSRPKNKKISIYSSIFSQVHPGVTKPPGVLGA